MPKWETKMARLICLAALFSLCQGQLEPGARPPRIFKIGGPQFENHHLTLVEGAANQFTLTCDVEDGAIPEPEITWYKNNEEISTLEGINFPTPKELEIVNPKIELHQGYYYCLAQNSMGTAKSEVVLISPEAPPKQENFYTQPKFIQPPEVEIQEEDKSVDFKCVPEGAPRPKISWTFNGEVMENFTDKETLTIPNITPDHIGTYACNASNLYGYEYKVVYLNILTQEPIFTEKPRNRTVSIGQEVIMRCAVKGYPHPEIRWYFEGAELTNDSESYLISNRGDLTVKKVLAQMEGAFECKATNSIRENSAKAYLKVVSSTTIIQGPVDTVAQVKGSVRMNCSVAWDPEFELNVEWKKDNLKLHVDGKRVTIDQDERFLTIRDLTFDDKGAYICVARTKTDFTTKTGTLQVIGIPPELIVPPSGQTVKEGDDIQVLCKVTGFPTPRHTWFKGSERILFKDNSRVTMDPESGTLIISNANLNDSAKYICSADNKYGEKVIASAFIDVTMSSKVIQPPKHTLLKSGQDVLFNCGVHVDKRLKDSTQVEWYINEERLDFETPEYPEYEYDYSGTNSSKFSILSNYSLLIKSPTLTDLGTYRCKITTPVDNVILEAVLYSEADQSWIMIAIIIVICVLILLILILCIICVRKRSRRKGRYGVKDVADGKRANRSDIQYSIDDDTESLHKDLDNDNRTPIIKPNSNRRSPLENHSDLKGSENSLLNMTDEDLWLRKGMDEDGSFRQVYVQE